MKRTKKSLKHTQYVKAKLRATPEWRQFRANIEDEYFDTDPITQKPLRLGWNLHHMRMAEETYDDLDPKYFLPLNKQTHETLHWLVRYAQKDPDFMTRVNYFVNEMVKLNTAK